MTRAFPLLAVAGLVVVAVSGAAMATASQASGDKMTICHFPPGNPGGARTMQVSRSSWSAHQDHGDHEGACTSADRRAAAPPSSPPPRDLPKTRLAVSVDGEGSLDGDASFRVFVANQGGAPGVGVKAALTVHGDGDWRVRPTAGVTCAAEGQTLACDYSDLPAETGLAFWIEYDAHLTVCRQASVDVRLTADNDSSQGDDRSRSSVWVGACSPLDGDGPLA